MSFPGSLTRLVVTLQVTHPVMQVFGATSGMGSYAEYLAAKGGRHRKETIKPLF